MWSVCAQDWSHPESPSPQSGTRKLASKTRKLEEIQLCCDSQQTQQRASIRSETMLLSQEEDIINRSLSVHTPWRAELFLNSLTYKKEFIQNVKDEAVETESLSRSLLQRVASTVNCICRSGVCKAAGQRAARSRCDGENRRSSNTLTSLTTWRREGDAKQCEEEQSCEWEMTGYNYNTYIVYTHIYPVTALRSSAFRCSN